MNQADTLEGLLLLPEAPGMDWAQTPGLVRCDAPLREGLTALASALEDGPAPAPDALHHFHRMKHAILTGGDPAWRGLLALCLLHDVWLDGPDLACVPADLSSAFAQAVTHGYDGPLTHVELRHGASSCLAGVLDKDVGVIPAAQMGDLSALLPPRVTWYDRERHTFTDPSFDLNERDAQLLLQRLKRLPENAALTKWQSELNHALLRPAQDAARQDEACLRRIRLCLEASLMMDELPLLTLESAPYRDMSVSPLLAALGQTHIMEGQQPQQTLLWQGVPVARQNSIILWESAGHPGEAAALDHLESTLTLLDAHSPRWNRKLAKALDLWLTQQEHNRTLSAAVRHMAQHRLETAQAFTSAAPPCLSWPWQNPAAMRYLWQEALVDALSPAFDEPFSHRLCIMPAAAGAALGDPLFSQVCVLPPTEEQPASAVLPPLSPALARAVGAKPQGSCLMPESLSFTREEDGAVTVRMTLTGEGTLVLTRRYAPEEQHILPPEDVPTLAVWPALPLPENTWQAYYVYLRGGLTARVLDGDDWLSTQDRLFSVLKTARFPAMIPLFSGESCLGAVPNLLSPCEPPRTGDWLAAVNIGASGVSVALAQGDHAEPLRLPCLVRTLLMGARPAPLAADFLPLAPLGPVFPTAVEMFSSAPDPQPLTDGHMVILSAGELAPAPAKGLCCDLKWAVDNQSRKARSLYLQQLMQLVSLAALLRGAQGLSWRLALPEGMSAEGRRTLWEDVAELIPPVSELTGLSPARSLPPLSYADETMAIGAYFRGEGGVRGGFMAIDVGAGGTSLALWLRGMNRPAMRTGIPLGVQAMLFTPLLAAPEHLEQDFFDLPDPMARDAVFHLAQHLRAAQGSRKAIDKARLLMDAVLAEHFPALCAHMNARFAQGNLTTTQALIICGVCALMTVSGLMEEEVYRDPLLNDHLPADMAFLLTGRGASIWQALPQTLQARMQRFLRLMMSQDHPMRNVRLSPSVLPKGDVVLGLARMKDASDLPPEKSPTLRPSAQLPLPPEHLIMHYLSALAQEFPYPCARLYLDLFNEYGLLTAEAERTIAAAARRHFTPTAQPEAAFAACLTELCSLEQLTEDE